MIILIGGATHTGKTVLASKLIKKYHFPCLSLDHLKMGLIRSGNTDLTVFDDYALTRYLWPIVREMIKTAIENKQDMIIEGCYFPYDWKKDFDDAYLKDIKMVFLIMTENYIIKHFDAILNHANTIEKRLPPSPLTKARLIKENKDCFDHCVKHQCEYILIDNDYDVDVSI